MDSITAVVLHRLKAWASCDDHTPTDVEYDCSAAGGDVGGGFAKRNFYIQEASGSARKVPANRKPESSRAGRQRRICFL